MRIFNRYIALVLLIACSSTLFAGNAKRPWTFFVYIAADNNLNPEADLNISQMVRASSTENVYIVVHLNIKRAYESKKTQKLIIQDGKITQVGQTTVEDSGDYKTFLNAMKWAVTDYPSDHLLIDVWNHGTGPLNRAMICHRGVCYDDSTGNYMTDVQYKRAFDVIVNQYRGGKKIDIITFDACLMANIEVANTLKNYAKYLVASQQTVPGPGYNYTEVLSIFDESSPTPLTFARWIVTAYEHHYKASRLSYTLSAIDLSKLSPAVSATNTIATQLAAALEKDNSKKVANAIRKASSSSVCPHFDEPTYIDLYSLYANLYSSLAQMGLGITAATKLKAALQNGLSTLAQCMVANVHSSDFVKTRGLSIYFADVRDGIEPSYQDLHWTSVNPAWLDFLAQYIEVA